MKKPQNSIQNKKELSPSLSIDKFGRLKVTPQVPSPYQKLLGQFNPKSMFIQCGVLIILLSNALLYLGFLVAQEEFLSYNEEMQAIFWTFVYCSHIAFTAFCGVLLYIIFKVYENRLEKASIGFEDDRSQPYNNSLN